MEFRFRFASLLELRRRERDAAGAEVGKALEAIQAIEQQQRTLDEARTAVREETTARLTGRISVDALLARGRYDLQLGGQSETLLQTRSQLEVELERRRQRLVEAEAEVKRFERLEERERETFRREMQRREQFEADDAAGRRTALARRAGRRGDGGES